MGYSNELCGKKKKFDCKIPFRSKILDRAEKNHGQSNLPRKGISAVESKDLESQLILVMDNFHCPCHCWSSESKGKGKNDFDNNAMGYWYFFMNDDYDGVFK